MDPEACLNDCDQAITDCDIDTARDRLSDYREWRRRSGYEPHMRAANKRGDVFADECAQRIESLQHQQAPV